MKKKILSLVLAAAMAASMAACGAKQSSPAASTSAAPAAEQSKAAEQTTTPETKEASAQPAASNTAHQPFEDPKNTTKSDETCTILMTAEPATLVESASGVVDEVTEIISNTMFDRLVRVDQETQSVVPGLAKEWEWVDDTHCKFTLRDDVIMSDGTPLVADDVVYTVGVWLEMCSSNDIGQYIDPAGAVANDEHTVTIGFSTKAPDILVLIAGAAYGIYTEDEVKAAGGLEAAGRNPVLGSGRYKFKEWVPGQYVVVERNENYWDKDYTGYFKEIRFSFIAESSSRVMTVLSGDAQVAHSIPVTESASYISNPEAKTYIYPIKAVNHLWFNIGENGQEVLKNEKVRKAIDLALDYEALNTVATEGFGKVQNGYFHRDEKMHTDTFTDAEMAKDVEGAKALLKEAGYENGGIDLRLVCLTYLQPMAIVIQACLSEIGINVSIETPDVPSFVQAAAGGDYDMAMVGDTTGARYPSVMWFMRNGGVHGFSIAGPKWTTDEIDAAIEKAIDEKDEAKAKEMFAELEKKFKDMTLYCNIYEEMHSAVAAKDIKGFTIMERQYFDATTLYK